MYAIVASSMLLFGLIDKQVVTSPSACKTWLQQLVPRQPIKLVLYLPFQICVQPCNNTPSPENLAELGREPIMTLLHALILALAGLAPWCEPGSAGKTTNQGWPVVWPSMMFGLVHRCFMG
jgi:hypothetical protein